MSFPFTGAGGFFTRFGHVGFLLNSLNSFIGTANLSAASITSLGTGIDTIAGAYATPDLNIISGLYPARDSYRNVHTTMQSYLQALAQATLVQMANDASAQPNGTLSTAVAYLVSQMVANAQTVQKPTISATSTANAGNVGTGLIPVSVLNGNGVQQDYILAESIAAACTVDSQSGATAGQETFTFTSPAAEANALQWDYGPGGTLGSGISVTQNAVDALVDNASGNLLQNGSFKTWTTPGVGPDNWLILVPGTGGVGGDILQTSGANVYKGTSGISFVGDGSSLPSISQPFNTTPNTSGNSGGTSATLKPLTVYCLSIATKMSSVPGAGALTIDLTDGNNTTTTNAATIANSLSLTLSSVPTSWKLWNVFFQTPAVLPSTGLRLRVRLSTALTAAVTVYFGHIALTPATQLYAGGPYVGVFSGSTNFFKPDGFVLAPANNYGSKFQLLADRVFGMRSLGLQLPSAASPTISDTLVA